MIIILSLQACGWARAEMPRERATLDYGWKFHLGDIPFPRITGHSASYNHAKAGTAEGAAAIKLDDSTWQPLDLPHDWAIELPVSKENNLAQGFRTRGIGWYRRTFALDAAEEGKNIELQFDGVSTFCTVWVNGIIAHRNWCGYTSFYIDITPFAKFGDATNTIAVRVDADSQEGWWYEGAGIYRHTWLVKRNPVHIETDGVFANPIRLSDARWTIPVEVTLANSGTNSAEVEIESTLLDAEGKQIVGGHVKQTIAPFENPVAKYEIAVASPTLWSVEQPYLYSVRTIVRAGNEILDEVTTHCGFRTIRFDANKGFFLNDQPLKLKGTCNHQDHAGVGTAMPDSMWEWRLRKLKEMGSNAYRCSHNPSAAEFLDACDRLGMLVMDENRNFNTTEEYRRQLQWLVRRDRNHPSVILWSVFNEEPMQGTRQGYEMVRTLAAVVKKLDQTRPVTAAQSGALNAAWNASKAADVAGFNYQPILQLVPHWNWSGSEGKPIKVMALSNAEKVRLSLNGKLIEEKPVDRYNMVSWDVPYESRKLEAVALKDGKEVGRSVVETTGAPVALRLIADRARLTGDGRDAQPITVQAVDEHGRPVLTAGNFVTFELSGPGTIIGVGNGTPLCHEPEKGNCRSLFNGMAQVIIQTKRGARGALQLKAAAEGLVPTVVAIAIE